MRQQQLVERVHQLESALARVKRLQELLPICAWCRRVRDDQDYWQELDTYLREHLDARFTHGICPTCRERCLHELPRTPAPGPLDRAGPA